MAYLGYQLIRNPVCFIINLFNYSDSDIHILDNSTLFALWRAYSSLDPSIDSAGHTNLAPPHRLIFSATPSFTDPKPTNNEHLKRRSRVDTGFHPYLAKAAFPQLSMQYLEDWDDYHKMEVPFVFERIVIADRSAAEGAIEEGQPIYSPAFGLEGGSIHWWEPVRITLATYLEQHEIKAKSRKVITYIHTQAESKGAKLSTEDHKSITLALDKMGRTYGYEVHVVSTQTNQTDWTTKMTAIVKSSVCCNVPAFTAIMIFNPLFIGYPECARKSSNG